MDVVLPMTNDVELLQAYVAHGDESAFRKLVERHLPMVYSAALRQVGGDKYLAEDIAQNVFKDLAQDAAGFPPNIAGRLYRATRFAAAKVVRTEKRRRAREAVAALEYDAYATNSYLEDSSTNWDTLHTLIDEAMNELAEADRDVILLRFFHGLDFRAVGLELNISDDTAQKRVTRALERLRRSLVQRGVAPSVTVLGALIVSNAVAAPPAGLAAASARCAEYTVASGTGVVTSGLFTKFGAILLRHKAACGAGTVVAGAIFAILLLNSRSPQIVTYDLSRDFPVTTNATSVWSFGWTPTLGGTFTRLSYLKQYRSDNGVALAAWQVNDTDRPGVGINMGTNTAVSGGGAFVGPPGAIWFGPESADSARRFGVIRFTLPPGRRAAYRVTTAVRSLFDGSLSKDIEFYVLKNGTRLFDRLLDPNSSATYSDVIKLYPGDTIDFVAGRGRSQIDESGLKIHAVLTTDLVAPKEDLMQTVAVAPLIVSPPRNQNEPAGGQARFEVAVGGSHPIHYQWWFGNSPLRGATNPMLLLSEIRAEQVGQYHVTVNNAIGVTTSSVARLTLTTCAPIPHGLVCWWSAEGSAGDRFGGQHGTRSAGTTFAPGRIGRGFLFQGEEAGIFMPASSSLDIGSGGSFTVEAWIKPAPVARKMPLVGWNSDTAYGANLSIGGGQLYANLRDAHGTPHTVLSRARIITADQWQHIALTYDAKAQSARLYCNGEMVADEPTEAFIPNTRLDLQFGRRRERDTVLTYSGLMDEISFYHRALSSEEIAAIANAAGAGKCVSPANSQSRK